MEAKEKKVEKRFGIFQMAERNAVTSNNEIFVSATNIGGNAVKETDFTAATSESFATYEEAENKLIEMPSPAMYCILPVYFVVQNSQIEKP